MVDIFDVLSTVPGPIGLFDHDLYLLYTLHR